MSLPFPNGPYQILCYKIFTKNLSTNVCLNLLFSLRTKNGLTLSWAWRTPSPDGYPSLMSYSRTLATSGRSSRLKLDKSVIHSTPTHTIEIPLTYKPKFPLPINKYQPQQFPSPSQKDTALHSQHTQTS